MMVDLLPFEATLAGRRALVTGHTGFTGGWLAMWLRGIGCEVTGLALAPETEPNLFSAAKVADHLESRIGDIRDFAVVRRAFEDARPTVVFHLAAQPLVSRAFALPLETFATNVIGTAHVLEAARLCASVKAVVCVTTDKVYADRDWEWGYREIDRLGGRDPYAASKTCAELVAGSYRAALVSRGNGCLIATARGGNIIGGGDWSDDRIVPDFVRAVFSSTPLILRSPAAVRPWQHVLALVHGYVLVAARLLEGGLEFADAWNFGPRESEAVPVEVLVDRLGKIWKRPQIGHRKSEFPETRFLGLDSTRARTVLGWRPPLDFDATVRLTAEWYRDFHTQPSSAPQVTAGQIDGYRRELGRAMTVQPTPVAAKRVPVRK
jgi:CDP-glucose 4,6-dehydratase